MGASFETGEQDHEKAVRLGIPQPRRLHVADFDRKRGVPVDPRFLEVAAEIEEAVLRYRSRELNDPALVSNMAERAVYKANWALYGMPCENPAGYVLTIFRRDADEYIQRNCRFVSVDERPGGYSTIAGTNATEIERRVLVREVLESIDAVTRVILMRRVEGDAPAEIGRALGLSTNAVSIRLSRAMTTLRKLLADQHGR